MSSTTWVGGDSGNETDWATGANWSTGSIPTTSAHVVIPNTTHNCALDQTRTIGSLTIQSGGTIVGGGNKLIIQSEGDASGGTEHYALKNDGIVSGNLHLEFTYAGETAADFNGSSGNFNDIKLNAASVDLNQVGVATFDSLIIVANSTYDAGNDGLTISGDVSCTGTFLGNSTSAVSHGSLTVNSGGTYNATSGTTTITSNTATGTRSVYNNGGTFTHKNGTLKINTSANTNYDFDGDDLYNFTVECEDGGGAVNCDGEASTAVTVLNNLDIVMGKLRTNANSFTIHGNAYVRETSKTNKNKFVAQGANQTVKGLITVEDGAFFDLANEGSGSYGTLNAGGIRIL